MDKAFLHSESEISIDYNLNLGLPPNESTSKPYERKYRCGDEDERNELYSVYAS